MAEPYVFSVCMTKQYTPAHTHPLILLEMCWKPPLWKREEDVPWWFDSFAILVIFPVAALLTVIGLFLLPFYVFGRFLCDTCPSQFSDGIKSRFYSCQILFVSATMLAHAYLTGLVAYVRHSVTGTKSRLFYCLVLLSSMMMRGRADCIVSNNPAVLNPYDPSTSNCTTTNPGQNVTLCSLESSLRLDGYGCPCNFASPCVFSPGQVPLADNPRFLWIDADGDGQGARGSAPVRRCSTGGGYVDNDWDCDDTNPAIFRGVAVCRSRHTTSLQTVYPDLNITSSPFTTIAAACSPIATVQRWGTSVSVHGTVLVMASPCRNVAVFFNWDDVAKQWVYQTNTQVYPCSSVFCPGSPILGSPGYGRSLSAWDPFAMVSSGTDNATDGLVVGFEILTHVGAAPWSRICCVASQTTIRQDSTNAATSWPHVQIANTRTVACYQGNAGGNSTAELGEIISNTYVPNDLCGCAGGACPTAWEAFRGSTNVCGASGLGLGKQCAIDRADGTQAVFADLNNNLYFFNFTSQVRACVPACARAR